MGPATEAMLSRLVRQMARRESITEQLKAENQMEWVRKMINIRNAAEEIVFSELIYTSIEEWLNWPVLSNHHVLLSARRFNRINAGTRTGRIG
jgi:Zn-dependent metalloprotease